MSTAETTPATKSRVKPGVTDGPTAVIYTVALTVACVLVGVYGPDLLLRRVGPATWFWWLAPTLPVVALAAGLMLSARTWPRWFAALGILTAWQVAWLKIVTDTPLTPPYTSTSFAALIQALTTGAVLLAWGIARRHGRAWLWGVPVGMVGTAALVWGVLDSPSLAAHLSRLGVAVWGLLLSPHYLGGCLGWWLDRRSRAAGAS